MRPILLVLAACAFFATTNVVARLVAETQGENAIHPLQITFCRYLAGFLLVLPAIFTRHAHWRAQVPLMYLLRSGGGVCSATCIFIGVAYLPLADVTAISYAGPFFALILAAIFLKETVGQARWGAVLLGFAGALLITRPTPDTFQIMALVPFAAAAFMGVELVVLRFVAQRDATGTVMIYTNGFGLVLSSLAMPFVWNDPTWEQAAFFLLIALATVTGQVLTVLAMAVGEASFLAPFYYSTLVYAALFGWLGFAEVPAMWTWGGSALIIAGGLWLAQSHGSAKR